MFNGDFTGLPRVSYYFTTSKEGQLKKKVRVCIYLHTNYIYIYTKSFIHTIYAHITIY